GFLNDDNGFIKRYCNDNGLDLIEISESTELPSQFSHAILFEDRDSYSDLKASFRESNIPTRVVPLKLTLVVNRDKGDDYDVYIGRGSSWGNPYRIGHDGDREEVIRKYDYDFQRKFLRAFDNFEENSKKVKGKILACHCKPYACHGDVIAKFFNSIDDGL
ncbi:DUF4326 domain-containing protein, partial [Comamonas sp.]|uniref:DUF4326 domain-containing protein n=1 Tax=Comamonas sp. TaxID=34028 RepID=UPI00264A4CDD